MAARKFLTSTKFRILSTAAPNSLKKFRRNAAFIGLTLNVWVTFDSGVWQNKIQMSRKDLYEVCGSLVKQIYFVDEMLAVSESLFV